MDLFIPSRILHDIRRVRYFGTPLGMRNVIPKACTPLLCGPQACPRGQAHSVTCGFITRSNVAGCEKAVVETARYSCASESTRLHHRQLITCIIRSYF
jgi:hypothetical protein